MELTAANRSPVNIKEMILMQFNIGKKKFHWKFGVTNLVP